MPDMILQHVDSLMVERIRALARERQCPVNDILLSALRNGLGMSAAQQYSESRIEPESLSVLDGHWEMAEQGVFQEALHALAQTLPTQLAPERMRLEGSGRGAE